MEPTISRWVHFHPQTTDTHKGKPRPGPVAALVVNVLPSGNVDLQAFYRDGTIGFRQDVPHSETPAPGRWSWPPRV